MKTFLNFVIGWYVISFSVMAACFATIFLRVAPQLNDALWHFIFALFVGEVGVRLCLFYAAKRQRSYLISCIAAAALATVLAMMAIGEAVVILF